MPTSGTHYGGSTGETNSYDLVLTRVSFSGPIGSDLVGNQLNVGTALETIFNTTSPSSGFADFLSRIQALPPGAPPSVYQQLAGEISANAAAIGSANAGQLLGLLFGRLGSLAGGFLTASSGSQVMAQAQPTVQLASAGRAVDIAQAPPGAPSSSRNRAIVGSMTAWISGFGQTSNIDSQPGVSGARANVAGGMVGIEKQFSDTFRIGVAIGAGSSWVSVHGMDSSSKGTFFQGAIYGSYAIGAWYIDAAAGYAFHSVDTDRTVQFSGFSNRLTANFNAHQFIGGVETGYNMDLGPYRVTPFVGLQTSVFAQGGYTKSGGSAALSFGSTTTTSVRSSFGVQLRTTFTLGTMTRIDPYVRVAWAHEFADRSATVTANFVGAPSSSFDVAGAERDRDAALIGAGFEMRMGHRFTVYAAYSGDIAGSSQSHAGTIGLRYTW